VANNLDYDVLIATYNGEKFIVEQLESILSQSVLPKKIIIRDDCSTDSTLEILNNYSDLTNMIIVPGTSNLGYIKNFEYLLTLASSPIIFFCDQDDYWDKDKAKLILQEFKTSQINVIFTNAYVVNSELEGAKTLWKSIGFNGSLPTTVGGYLYDGNVVTGATMACKLNFIKDVVPFPDSIPHDFWIAINALYQNTLSPFNRNLIRYRQHNNNAIGVNQAKGLTKLINKFSFNAVEKRRNDAVEKSRIYVHFIAKFNNDKSLVNDNFMALFVTYGCTPLKVIKEFNTKNFIIQCLKRPVLLYDFIVVRLFRLK